MGGRRARSGVKVGQTALLFSVAMVGFFAGTLVTMHTGLNNCEVPDPNSASLQQTVETLASARLKEMEANLPPCQPCEVELDPDRERQMQRAPVQMQHDENSEQISNENKGSNKEGPLEFPPTASMFAVGMGRTSKEEFVELLDMGVPIESTNKALSQSDVLIIYSREDALPASFYEEGNDGSDPIPDMAATEALEHCEYLNIIMTDPSKGRNQCLAIVPQYESYHIQKWMRLPSDEDISKAENRRADKLSFNYPLRLVSRGKKNNGVDEFAPPQTKHMEASRSLLSAYFAVLSDSLEDLKPLVEKVATPSKTVAVMVSNFGQSELLVNFVCAARSRQLETSHVLVFATDPETKALAEHLGLTAFYDEKIFGSMPQEAAGSYGDRKFTAMMMAKVFCVQMVSALKYNILFQDVDIVWYKDPIPFFESDPSIQDFDMIFQDDGGHSVRYAPYSANSGFYYVRYNAKTEYFFHSLLLAGDLIQKTDSHQQALIALLSEHVSLFGLRVKVFSRDDPDGPFPGGFQFHQRSGEYMRRLLGATGPGHDLGPVHPYIFHMSWTLNKDNKLLFLKQLGEWYVQDQCVHQKVEEVLGTSEIAIQSEDFLSGCCSAEALISCHYRDKPSKIPCRESPPIDKGRPSFWK